MLPDLRERDGSDVVEELEVAATAAELPGMPLLRASSASLAPAGRYRATSSAGIKPGLTLRSFRILHQRDDRKV